MPPVIDSSKIEKEAYIPMEFAQSKMEEVTNDLNLLKTGYDHYISKMKVFYDNQNKETKSHYETYILDLKKKALKHLELERAKAKKREETLQTALQKKEEEMEDLRDMNAERISDLQNKMLLVKKQHQTELSDRQQCDLTLKRMLMIIENEGVKDISNELVEKLSKQKNDEVSVIKNDHTQIIKKIEDDKKQHEKKVAREKKELKLQERDRAKKQIARSTACEESKVFMSDLLQQLQLKKQELLLNKERRKLDLLQRSKGDYEKSIVEMKDQMEAEREKSAAAIKKYGKKCKSLQNEKESLLAEKEALVAENQAAGRRREKEHQRNQRADIKSALYTIVSEVEIRSRIDNELAHERKKINELNNVIDGLKKEISEAESRAPLRKDGVNQADTKGQPLPVTSTYSEAQKSADVSELEKLREKLADLQYDVEVDEEELTDTVKEKADTKAVIKDWMKKFEAENGRPPNNEEKSSVRDMFVAHKTATKKVEAVTSAIEAKKGEINTLKDQIAALEKKIADAELSMTPTVVGGGNVPDEVVQGYKQRISELEASNSELNKTAQAAELDKNSALALIETLKAEKRTDVIVRYEKEIEELKRNIHDLETSVASSKTERTKLESRVTELSDRATKAEEELKEQEDRAAKNMGHSEEIQQLQEKIVKQRAEIVSKSKAATAGWDEAAETMEKFDLAVKQSYQKGIAEGKQNSKAELDALTAEIEAKENRISDLLEAVSAADQKAAQAAVELEEAIKNANIAIEEAATGRQNERGGSDSDSDDDAENGGYASKELQAELDAAQEEITTLCSQVDSLQNALHLSNEKCDVLEKLLAQPSSNATVKSDASVEGLVQKVKQTTEEGTKLWKDNKKDECCDLYETVSNEIAGANCPQQLRDAVTSALDSAKGQSKRRAAVILRKGLDNFVAEADKIHPTTTAAPISDGNNSDHDALLHKLKAIQKKSDEQKSESKQGTGDESGGGNAALVRRAKAAEEKVKSLQKELAAAKKATPKGKPSAAGGKGSADDAKEIKNLNKQIKELEKQLNAGGGGGGGGGNAAKDKIALANQEKKFKKEIKEMETANRKEKASLEKELGGVKGELEKVTASCNAATEERDKLRKRVEELGNANSEMEALRAKAEQAEELQAQIKAMKKEIADLTAQYKKESNLRKKYKNELEDLKGAIRVYARVRPFAKYEIERGCESVVRFPDETSVTVQTSRGEKEFEFDAAFREDTSQEEVFEDTKRLVESMIDGYNVCLFAYGQVGFHLVVAIFVSLIICFQSDRFWKDFYYDWISRYARPHSQGDWGDVSPYFRKKELYSASVDIFC